MISAGDRFKLGLTPKQEEAVDTAAVTCPKGTFGKDAPKEGDCDYLLAQLYKQSVEGLPPEKADEFADIFVGTTNDLVGQCLRRGDKDQRACAYSAYKDDGKDKKAPKIGAVEDTSYDLVSFREALRIRALRMGSSTTIVSGGSSGSIAFLTRPVPTQKFSDFIKELKSNGMIRLAHEAMRLFNDATEREDFDAAKLDALVDSIIEVVKIFSDAITNIENETDKNAAISLAHDALSKTVIYNFAADGKGEFRSLPEEVWGDRKNLVEKTGLRKLFTQAIPHYLKNDKAPTYANSDANIAKALKELGDAMLAAIAANDEKNPAKLVVQDVKAEDDGKPKEVIFADKAAAAKALVAAPKEDTDGRELPIRLILGLGAGWNDMALEALKKLWRAAYLKNVKLSKLDTPEREKAIDSMIEQLGGASPVGIKSASVEKVDKNGTVHLKDLPERKFADSYLATLESLEPDMYMAFYDKINELHREAVDSADFEAKKFTEEDVAAAIEKSLKDAIGGGKPGGLKKFADLHFKRGEKDETSGKSVPIFSARDEWWRANISLEGSTNFNKFAGKLSVGFGGVHDIGKNLAVEGGIRTILGVDVNKFGVDPSINPELILQAGTDNKEYAVLPEATVGIGSTNEAEEGKNKFNWNVTGGIKYDDNFLEQNMAGAWGTFTGLFGDVGKLSFEAGLGGMVDLDLGGKRDMDGGPFFLSGKLRGETKLWKNATLEAGLWYLYRKGISDVLIVDGSINQKLPVGFGLSATGMYAMDVGSDAPTEVGYVSPTISWDTSNIFTFGVGKKDFYLRLAALYELVNVNGVNRHGIGGNFGIAGPTVNGHKLLFSLGYTYYMQDQANPIGLTKDVSEKEVIPDPGADGHLLKFKLTFNY